MNKKVRTQKRRLRKVLTFAAGYLYLQSRRVFKTKTFGYVRMLTILTPKSQIVT